MDYEFLKNGVLLIKVEEDERKQLQEDHQNDPDFQSDKYMHEFLEPLTCNSVLDWVDPGEIGDLTDAPMLGIRGTDDQISYRWAWMNYEVKSLQQELLLNGEARLIGSRV